MGRLLVDESVTAENVHVALRIYETIRKPLATRVADYSRMCGDCYDFNYIPENIREAGVACDSDEGLKLLSETVYSMWSHHWTGSPGEDWLAAEKLLRESHPESVPIVETVARL